MNKKILIIILVAAAAIAAYFIFRGGYSQAPQNQTPANNTGTPAGNGQLTPPASQGTTAAVSIANFSFQPPSLTIKTGTTVIWTSDDSAPHQIKSSTFNSVALSKGQSFSFTFANPGTYNYSCSIHPSMKGQIIVQ